MDVQQTINSLPNRTPAQRRVMRDHAEAWKQSGSPQQKQAARQVLDALDDLEKAETEALVEHVRGLTKAQRVVEAFSDPEMTETERAVIQVLLDNPGSSSTALSEALSWGGKAWHLHFGTMCFNRRTRLWPAPPFEKRDADFYSGILADFEPETSAFTMKAEAAEGFAILGIRPRRS